MNQQLKLTLGHLFWIGFTLNLLWEFPQCWLYELKVLAPRHLLMLFLAVLGDALAVIFIFAVGIWCFKDKFWFTSLNLRRSGFALGSGFLIGVVGETVALKLGWWSYGSNMPEIPVLNVGLSPVAQMTLLPYASLLLVKFLLARKVDLA